MEKIHGTSANVSWDGALLRFHSGGESAERFKALFDFQFLSDKFIDLGFAARKVTVFGEAYGGKQQGMADTYGKDLKFIAFDVCLDESNWLSVPEAEAFCQSLNIDFVPWVKITTDLKEIDAQRDLHSIQAIRNGVTKVVGVIAEGSLVTGFELVNPKKREGIVLRPLIDLTTSTGSRIICKHKGDDFRETASPRVVDDPAKMQVMADAEKIANEWVTMTRLEHVLDKIPGYGMDKMPIILKAMVEDVTREAKGEIVDNDTVRKAITKKTAVMMKDFLKSKLK